MKRKTGRFLLLLTSLVALTALSVGESWALKYRIQDLGTCPYFSNSVVINNTDQIAGAIITQLIPGPRGQMTIYYRAVKWQNGVMTNLPVPVCNSSAVCGINDSGQMVGNVDNVSVTWQQDGTMQYVAVPVGALNNNATSINNSGQIVGVFSMADYQTHPYLSQNGVAQDLGTLNGGTYAYPFAINNSGQVAGYSYNETGLWHSVIWQNGTITDLNPFTTENQARDINGNGQVIGMYYGDNVVEHCYLWQNGTLLNVGNLSTLRCLPNAINSIGQIVGHTYDANANTQAFVSQNGVTQMLSGLGGTNSSALDINDNGKIVGRARDRNEVEHIVLWEPVH